MRRSGAVLVTGASGSVGYNLVRTLREADPNLLIVSGCVMPLGPGFLSPIIDIRYVLPRFDLDPAGHLSQLMDLVVRYEIDTIMAGGDADVSLLSLFRDELSAIGAQFLVPSHASVEVANDKRKTYEFAARHAIPQPRYVVIDPNTATLEALAHLDGNKMVVKDRCTYTAVVPNAVTALEMCKWIGGMLHEDMLVQEYIAAREISTLSLVDGLGTILQTVAICKFLTDREGETREAMTVEANDVVDMSEHVIRLLDWKGPIEIEWRVCESTGRPVLQEINGRFPAWVFITTATGQNLPWVYREVLLGRNPGKLPPYRRGVMFSRTPHDNVVQMARL